MRMIPITNASLSRRRGILRAMKIIVRWLLLAAALLLVAYLYPGVTVKSFGAAMIAAFVLGLFNTLLLYFAASVLDGFHVAGFLAALIGSLLYSLCAMVIDVAMERIFAS